MAQKQVERRAEPREEDEVQEFPVAKQVGEAAVEETVEKPADTNLDDILDQIDKVLEVNAAEFVAAYVQKGGQ